MLFSFQFLCFRYRKWKIPIFSIDKFLYFLVIKFMFSSDLEGPENLTQQKYIVLLLELRLLLELWIIIYKWSEANVESFIPYIRYANGSGGRKISSKETFISLQSSTTHAAFKFPRVPSCIKKIWNVTITKKRNLFYSYCVSTINISQQLKTFHSDISICACIMRDDNNCKWCENNVIKLR